MNWRLDMSKDRIAELERKISELHAENEFLKKVTDAYEGKKNEAEGKPKIMSIVFRVTYLGQGGHGYNEHIERTIVMKETQSLHDLHEAIIHDGFEWEDPHLYSFFMDNQPPQKGRDKSMEYTLDDDPNSPVGQDINSPGSSYTLLKHLDLKLEQKFLFLFDYGDDHHFEIQVTDFGEVEKGKSNPRILSKKGKAPEQYPEIQ